MKYIPTLILRVVLLSLIFCWMYIIFGFSSDTGQQSQSLSDKITIKVVKIIEPQYNDMSLASQQKVFKRVSFWVRKTGHFGEYGILGLLVTMFLLTFDSITRKKYIIIITTLWCFLYAVSDEVHQGFVDGRSPMVRDVLIDTAGGFAAVGFVIVIILIIEKRRKNEGLGTKH